MDNVEATVEEFYGGRDVLARVLAAVRAAGADPDNLTPEDLYPIDQLHARGIAATREHADRAGVRPGMHILELGCGVGGASRCLAAEKDCRVTGIDLTRTFVEVARDLTERCGLSDRIAYRQASALKLPFEDATFDHVWSCNVTMNIEDKAGLAREVARVLRPGCRFSCSEYLLGPAGEPSFPLPWAVDPSSSFLVTPAEMRRCLEEAGLEVVEQIDLTEANLAFAREQRERAERGEPPLRRPGVVSGDDIRPALQNAGKCIAEGRLVEQLTVAVKG